MVGCLKRFLVAAVAVTACASVSMGAIIAWQDGENNAFGNWAISASQGGPAGTLDTGVLGAGVSVGGRANVGEVTDNTGVGPDVDIVYNTSGLTGNYMNFSGGGEVVRSVFVEFYSYQNVGSGSSDFRLYMLASGNVWYYDVGPLAAGWNYIYANMIHLDDPFTIPRGWYSEDGRTPAQFLADITSVTAIGFELQYLANANQTYGFDYIGLLDSYYVPEPETYLMLAVALASLAFVFRENVRQALGTALSAIRS